MSDEAIEEIKRRKLEELTKVAQTPAADEPIELEDESDLPDLFERHRIVLVDCHAEWCGPCKQLAPIVQQVAANTEAAVVKVDIDRQRSLAQRWTVRSVPTLLLFVDGEPVERLAGVQSFDRLQSLIQAHSIADQA